MRVRLVDIPEFFKPYLFFKRAKHTCLQSKSTLQWSCRENARVSAMLLRAKTTRSVVKNMCKASGRLKLDRYSTSRIVVIAVNVITFMFPHTQDNGNRLICGSRYPSARAVFIDRCPCRDYFRWMRRSTTRCGSTRWLLSDHGCKELLPMDSLFAPSPSVFFFLSCWR